MFKYLILVSSVLLFKFVSEFQAEPLVKITQGLLEGITFKTRNGRNFSAFTGIPYAEPPIKKLRFSRPLPAKNWQGIRLANKEGNFCPQPVNGMVIGDEDCLILNVFTPRMTFDSLVNRSLLPVMVWIHGGGFHTENSNLSTYGPNYLLDKDIVLVSINYRLGILGFLSTGDRVAPGNFGLKDQVLALKWVQKNIRVFGGDPNRVTIFGESAGGASVTFHALSNSSDGLFHQYIIQSGNTLVPWGYRDRSNFKSDVNYIAENVDCPTHNSEILIKCLRAIDHVKLVNLTKYNVLDFPELLWIPTNEVESEYAFLTESPKDLINQNKMRNYPFMSGVVADEGLYITAPFYGNFTTESSRNILDRCINSTSRRFLKPGDLPKFKEAIKDYYFNASVSSQNEDAFLESFTKFAGDSEFVYPAAILPEKMVKDGKSPVYLYLFGYRGRTSYLTLDYDIDDNIGVTHADDLLYLFSGNHSQFVSETDEKVIDLMVDLWTSFAMNGKPASKLLAIPNIWQPYSVNRSFLRIGNTNMNTDPLVTLEQNYFSDRVDFWKKHVPILNL